MDLLSVKKEKVGSQQNDINPMKAEELADGGVLRLVVNSLPSNWNTGTVDGNDTETNLIGSAIYPDLVDVKADGTYEPSPLYFKCAEVVSEKPFTVELEFNEGIKWSDGTPLNYKSFANVVEVLTGKRGEGYNFISSRGYDQITSLEQGDNDRTVRVVFDPVYPDWISLLSVAPDQLCATPDAWNKSWIDGPRLPVVHLRWSESIPLTAT